MTKTRRRKKRTHVPDTPDPSKKGDPKTFVLRRGKHAALLADLEMDVRRMMLPNTALNLQESRRNVLKDFVQVAGPLGVTHFIMLSSTDANHYLKVARTPRGPTLSLRILSYSLMRDVQSAQARPRVPPNAFKTPPLVVLNGFAGQQHLQLFTTMFQSMFPSINVAKVRLAACQRVVLLALDKATGVIRLRHYTISLAPSGLRKGLKGLLQRSSLPDMSSMQDVAEFMTRGGYGSESEGEEAEASRVTLGQDLGKGNAAGRASRVRLHEVGPRLELQLMKVEEGLCSGAVLYHALVAKTAEEAAALAAKHEEQAALKEVRRRKQEENVKRKAAEQAAKDAAKEAAAARKRGGADVGSGAPRKTPWWQEEPQAKQGDHGAASDDDDDGDDTGEDSEGGGDGQEPAGKRAQGDANGKGATRGGKDNHRDPRRGPGGGKDKKQRAPAGDDEDDDVQYFKDEVGHEPEETDMIGRGGTAFGRGNRGGGRGRSRGRGGRGGRGRSSGGGGGGRGERDDRGTGGRSRGRGRGGLHRVAEGGVFKGGAGRGRGGGERGGRGGTSFGRGSRGGRGGRDNAGRGASRGGRGRGRGRG